VSCITTAPLGATVVNNLSVIRTGSVGKDASGPGEVRSRKDGNSREVGEQQRIGNETETEEILLKDASTFVQPEMRDVTSFASSGVYDVDGNQLPSFCKCFLPYSLFERVSI
jgi:hypothetical protein